MNNNKNMIYYLGLDMGTNDVGYAVTDTNYNLIRVKGKDLWGVREFEKAKAAAERRSARISRRRNQRDIARRGIVKLYFDDAINKIDSLFFIRLENSKFYAEDKDAQLCGNNNGLFNDKNFTDKDYYALYPTIFHLRKALLDGDKDALSDVRRIYLAINNMFKHRGHFLLNGVDGDMQASELECTYEELIGLLESNYNIVIKSGMVEKIVDIIGCREYGRKQKYELVSEILDVSLINKKDQSASYKKTTEMIKCICGLSASANIMFSIETEEKFNICFNDFNYTDKISEIIEKIGESNYEVIELMKSIYDYAALSGVLNGCEYLSEARIKLYDQHKKDLALLKKVYRKYKTKEEYDNLFRSINDGTYSAYVHSVNSNATNNSKKKYRRNMSGMVDALYDTVKKGLDSIKNDKDVDYIIDQINKEQFLPKQLTGANGIIPNQVHLKELNKILKNAEEYHPFLLEKDESGLTVSERISRLYAFQIPYYIGPVGANSKTGWAIRRESGAILPWNINDKIDVAATSAEFIHRLIRECTYISGEKVMPKASLQYEKYCLLNEINNIRIDGDRISTEDKQRIYNEKFLKGKKVTREEICEFLGIEEKNRLTGVDININSSLSSYGKLYSVFGDKLNEDSCKEIAERIIYYGTIYADSKAMFRAELNKMAEEGLIDKKDINRLAGYKFKDWGRYSKAFLELEGHDPETGEIISLIGALWQYSYNVIELINMDEFGFKQSLEDKKVSVMKSLSDFEVEDLEEYYFSPSVRRMVWQTLLVIKEIEKNMGCEPEKIFIEMTRSDEEKGDKGRKDSRGKQLLECYKSIKNTDIHDWKNEITDADKDGRLRSKKLFLYYCQMGKDMYTGKDIDLESLFNDNLYDIDHIYPRHFVKDDSILNNLVLVNKKDNEHIKKDVYPIPANIRGNKEVRNLWDMLHQKKLINDEKYKRLTCGKEFTEEQMAGFIARQLVETSQGTKGVADILKQLLPNTKIVYSKAGNVSDFRRDYGLLKSRLLNEFHHANDAYLNIVVGNVYDTKFTQNPYNFIHKEYMNDIKKNNYHLARMYERDVVRNGRYAWVAGNEGTIKTVREVMEKNTPIITYLSYENTGILFDLTKHSKYKAKPDNYIQLKNDSRMTVEKYGGYNSINPAYFIFIEHGNSKKRKRCFDMIPILKANQICTEEEVKKYCEDELGYIDVRVICKKIKKGSLIKMNGYFLYISGLDSRKNVEFHNATNLCLSGKYRQYAHYIEKALEKGYLGTEISIEKNIYFYEELIKKHTKGIFAKSPKSIGNVLIDGKEKFIELDVNMQVEILGRLVSLTSLKKGVFSLKEIGGPSENGRFRISGNMTGCNELLLVNRTPAGLTETVINLME